MNSRKFSIGISLSLIVIFLNFIGVFAQEADPTAIYYPSDNEVNRVAKNLYCPVCENVPLDVCETQACADWRADIRSKLGAGWSDQQIYDYFVEQHGDRVLASPPPRGLNWLIYIVPPLAILAGVILLVRTLRTSLVGQSSSSRILNKPTSATDDEYAARIEEQLKNSQ